MVDGDVNEALAQVSETSGQSDGLIPEASGKSASPRRSKELIERARGLMERAIEFVPHADFDRRNAETVIQSRRPASLDDPAEALNGQEAGVAFVSGLVEARLLTLDEERYLFTWMNFVKFRAEQNRRKLDLKHPALKLIIQIEKDLAEAIETRNHIVRGNLRLIIASARHLTNSLEQMSDLISEGMTPLIRSVELFDISLGNRFSTYATWAIRNQMFRWLKRTRNSPERSLGDETFTWETLPDHRLESESTDAAQVMRVSAVQRLLESLSERERHIIAARFALDGQPAGQSLADIALQMGLSKERVRQIALNSLTKLRESMSFEEFEALG